MSPRRKRGKLPPAFTAAALDGHSLVGLIFSALIYLICVTGSLSVLTDELKLAEQPRPAAGPLRPGAIDRAVAAALAQVPDATSLYALAPVTPRQRLTLSAYGPAGARTFVADADGRIVAQRTPFNDFVTELHMTLTAPAPWGSLIVGFAGAALLALIVSGVLAHPRIFRDAFRLRLDGGRRLREAELHNRLSVWGLPFHVTVSLTGALFGLANLAIVTIAALGWHGDSGRVLAPITGPVAAADPRPAPLPDLERLATRARQAAGGGGLYDLELLAPGTRGARISVEVARPGRLPRGEVIRYDAAGREVGRGRFVTGPLGLQAYSAAAQLHFGFFGGLPVRLVYVALGGALSFVAASGVTIWLERRADRGHPAPRLRALWLGWAWGVPAALGAAALAAPRLAPGLSFWVVLAALLLAALWRAASRLPER